MKASATTLSFKSLGSVRFFFKLLLLFSNEDTLIKINKWRSFDLTKEKKSCRT